MKLMLTAIMKPALTDIKLLDNPTTGPLLVYHPIGMISNP